MRLLLIQLGSSSHSGVGLVSKYKNAFGDLYSIACELQVAVVLVMTANNLAEPPDVTRAAKALASLWTINSVAVVAREHFAAKWVFVPIKNLVGHDAPCLGFHIELKTGDSDIPAAVLVWDPEPASRPSTEFLLPVHRPRTKQSALAAAQEFLVQRLRAGPQAAKVVKSEAEQARISAITLRRACDTLKIKTYREGGIAGRGHQMWALPSS